MLGEEVPIGRKLFEETDKPTETKIVSENKEEGVKSKTTLMLTKELKYIHLTIL
jgi:hypothetical protein